MFIVEIYAQYWAPHCHEGGNEVRLKCRSREGQSGKGLTRVRRKVGGPTMKDKFLAIGREEIYSE